MPTPDTTSPLGAIDQPDRAHDAAWLDSEQQRIWRTYLRASHALNSYLDRCLRPFGLSLSEYEILVNLSDSENWRMRMSELAEASSQSRSRLTHTITRMEKLLLVERQACPSDRRGVWAQMTDKGFELLQHAAPAHVASVRAALVDIADPADLAAMGRVFEAMLAVPEINELATIPATSEPGN